MKLRTVTAVVCAVTVVVTAALGPAAAQTADQAKQERARTEQRQREVAAQLDVLHASDAQLEVAVADLDTRIAAQEAAVAEAHAAMERAQAEATRLGLAARAAASRVRLRRRIAADRAVAAYMHPTATSPIEVVLDASDVDEAARRLELSGAVVRADQDVIGGLRRAKADLDHREAAADAARQDADRKRSEASRLLIALEADRKQQAEARSALAARMAEFDQEADALAAQQSRLTRLIAQREAEQRAAEAASRRRAVTAPAAPVTGTRSPNAPALIWPVDGPVTSEFGYRWGRMHQGIDIAANMGDPIRAAASGTVFFAGEMNGYGNVVLVDHGRGFVTLYAHQSRLGVRPGQQVAQGDLVGYAGSTGHSTGPHVHFETRVNGVAQNPRLYLPKR